MVYANVTLIEAQSWQSGARLICVTSLLVALHRHDERLLLFIVQRRDPVLDRVMRVATRVADPAPAVMITGLITALPATRAQGTLGLFTLIFSHLLVQLLKRSFCRERPSLAIGIASLVQPPDCFSFPSGHSAAAAALALTITLVAPAIGPIALAGACLVGASRCYLGVHYPGDVLAGWVLSGLALAAGTLLLPL